MELFLRLFIMEMGPIEMTFISEIIIDFNVLILIVINAVRLLTEKKSPRVQGHLGVNKQVMLRNRLLISPLFLNLFSS